MNADSRTTAAREPTAAILERYGIRPNDDELGVLESMHDVARQAAGALGHDPELGAPFPLGAFSSVERTPGAMHASQTTAVGLAAGPRSAQGPDGPIRSMTAIVESLAAGELSSEELVDELLRRADELDPQLGVYLARFDAAARRAARESDERRARGEARGRLDGVPIAIKDLIATDGAPTTAQSKVMPYPTGFDAHCVARLRDAGAVIVGKTTLNEHATGRVDLTGELPVPRNPWDRTRWPGGSSSGSAAGVAAALFPAALGTDTGGSIRIPAALCGVAGFKPSYGAVDTTGVAPLAWSVDCVGPIAVTAADCALVHQALVGRGNDRAPAASGTPIDLAGLRVGADESWLRVPGVDPAVERAFERALETFARAGAVVTRIDLAQHVALADIATLVAQSVEAFEVHRHDLATRWDDYGVGTRPFLVTGAFFDAAEYVRAQRVRTRVTREVGTLMSDLDVIVSPTVGVPAPPIDADHAALIPLFFTKLWNAVGFPALSIPMGFSTEPRLPLGLQIAAPHGADDLVLRCGCAFERVHDVG